MLHNYGQEAQTAHGAIQSTQKELKADFLAQISKLKQEVTAGQENSVQEAIKSLTSAPTNFNRRVTRHGSYMSDSSVEEHIGESSESWHQ